MDFEGGEGKENGNPSIAENAGLVGFVEETFPTLGEGNLSIVGVLNSLDLYLSSRHMIRTLFFSSAFN